MKITRLLSIHKWKFAIVFSLLLLESFITLLFPLFIGFAIDDAINGDYLGSIQLGGLGILIILIGGGRRFYDSRFYANLYKDLGSQVLTQIKEDKVSLKTGRLGMINEFVEFLENALPALVSNIIGVFGVIIIIATLNIKVFIIGIVATALVFIIYVLTKKKTIRFNKSYNNEIEKQVDVISTNDNGLLHFHLKELMTWNVKLSDLEVFNFSLSWIILMVFLVLSVILSIDSVNLVYGTLFSLIMYVFQYIESVISLPSFYQSWLRLMEIKHRLFS